MFLITCCLCFIVILSQHKILSTIDVNINELEYLASRLNPFECRRLIAALHYTAYELPNNLAEAERNVDDDIPCIRHLIHWNSSPAEGKGKTHESLAHRLRQINRNELADWLGKSAFTQLGKDLSRAVENSFTELAKEEREFAVPVTLVPKPYDESDPWIQIDIILLAVLLGLLGTLLTLICATIFHKIRDYFHNRYKKLNEKDTDSENENTSEKEKKIIYSTESSDENTEYAYIDSETEMDFR
ncbi:uncharacterized protein LOC143174871 [Nomia melanderi]|uniref:uncharacterized protein LOC143174871 n=1 Tax=Nomia melanderi TaxID=2448451 RepID=UPI003FCCE477